jgi:hypothetical protein
MNNETEQTNTSATVQEMPKRGKARQYGDLPARPIMIYPPSEADRSEFEEVAREEGRKLSPFIVWVVKQYIRDKRLADSPEGRLAEARKRLSVR